MTASGKSSAMAKTPSHIAAEAMLSRLGGLGRSRQIALVALAHLDVRNGREAEVIVQTENDLFRPAWDSSRDSYPPPLVPDL